MRYVEKYGTARQVTDDDLIWYKNLTLEGPYHFLQYICIPMRYTMLQH